MFGGVVELQLVGQVLVAIWLVWDLLNGGLAGATVMSVAIKLLWAIGAVVVFSIIAAIIMTIIVSIARREEFKDEPADERDLLIEAKSQKWSAVATSIVAALALFPLAFGADPVFADARVLDARGRTVRVLASGLVQRGGSRIAWDGRDASGNRLVPGAYFVRVSGPLGTTVTRIVSL